MSKILILNNVNKILILHNVICEQNIDFIQCEQNIDLQREQNIDLTIIDNFLKSQRGVNLLLLVFSKSINIQHINIMEHS